MHGRSWPSHVSCQVGLPVINIQPILMPPSKKRERAATTQILTVDGVATLLQKRPQTDSPGPVLQVIAIRRHALSEAWFTTTKEKDRPQLEDAFDVTLSDGQYTVKCALSTTLNARVYSGWLRDLSPSVSPTGGGWSTSRSRIRARRRRSSC